MAGMGITPEEAARHVGLFRNPPPFTRVIRPCRVGDGILQLDPADHPRLLARAEESEGRGLTAKLVPASGAASRMFKALLAFLSGETETPTGEVRTFFENLPHFAFYEYLAAVMAGDGLDLDTVVRRGDLRTVLSYLLTGRGIAYAELPKGLLLFHRYPDRPRTPFEEHLVEAAATVRDDAGVCRLHFTVSLEHEAEFHKLLDAARPLFEDRLGCRFEVSFSCQRHATDTLAVDLDNQPFRLEEDGSLLFRPGGHGALLDNLNELAAAGWDVVLLKNIDNVVPDARKPVVHHWKQLLTGCLLLLRGQVFAYLERLHGPDGDDPALLDEVRRFLHEELSRPAQAKSVAGLIEALDRPLRVCGVVRNQGEPGGGPFWVESPEGEVTLQIVETSQIDRRSPEQQAALAASTHFNPVDIVCGLHDWRGQAYDLHRFVDPATVFIAEKSHEGRPLKALERPGLWNGAMAGWNTVFVEVPDETFAPVKTVLDLLRPEHQEV